MAINPILILENHVENPKNLRNPKPEAMSILGFPGKYMYLLKLLQVSQVFHILSGVMTMGRGKIKGNCDQHSRKTAISFSRTLRTDYVVINRNDGL